MHSIESMEAQVVEIKKETKFCRDITLSRLDELSKVLKQDEENSEEITASAPAEAELGG